MHLSFFERFLWKLCAWFGLVINLMTPDRFDHQNISVVWILWERPGEPNLRQHQKISPKMRKKHQPGKQQMLSIIKPCQRGSEERMSPQPAVSDCSGGEAYEGIEAEVWTSTARTCKDAHETRTVWRDQGGFRHWPKNWPRNGNAPGARCRCLGGAGREHPICLARNFQGAGLVPPVTVTSHPA